MSTLLIAYVVKFSYFSSAALFPVYSYVFILKEMHALNWIYLYFKKTLISIVCIYHLYQCAQPQNLYFVPLFEQKY